MRACAGAYDTAWWRETPRRRTRRPSQAKVDGDVAPAAMPESAQRAISAGTPGANGRTVTRTAVSGSEMTRMRAGATRRVSRPTTTAATIVPAAAAAGATPGAAA